ncbi:potassium/sodium hyperpolarization-activated cyclic nucleotide-gated channel 1 [Calliopsis andreniformis]|uniref:potassium/sodium hyperpolarization-activated cyclic nucleotide-gated channel 1 n=1 Tax=Calliopsis andreniformis TaxID=337506 RepID=UPI003FCDE519
MEGVPSSQFTSSTIEGRQQGAARYRRVKSTRNESTSLISIWRGSDRVPWFEEQTSATVFLGSTYKAFMDTFEDAFSLIFGDVKEIREDMKQHVCALPKAADSVYLMFTGVENLSFKQLWINMFKISRNTPRTKMYLDSMAAVFAERRRHAASKYWWIIHPFSYPRFIWDVIMIIVLLIGFTTIPFSVAFVIMCHDGVYLDQFNPLIYVFCWLNIIFNLLTGYYSKYHRRFHLEPLKIIRHYLMTFLIPDVLSSLPWDYLTLSSRRLPGQGSNHLIVLINLLPLLKLTRFQQVKLYVFELFTHLDIMHFYYEMLITLMLGFYIMFWFSCFCYLLPVLVLHFNNQTPQNCRDCWITALDTDSIEIRFQQALYIVVEQLVASGYGMFVPKTIDHIALSSLLKIIGRLLECYILVMLIQVKEGREESKTKFQEIINQVTAYTRQKQLPKHMKKRLLDYYYYRFRNSYFREKLILSNISEQLRHDIALQSSHRLVQNVAIFKTLPKNVLRNIVKNLRFELYLPNDVIVKAGAQGDCMFFLSAGTVAVLTPTGKEICHLDDGAHFGEVALLVPDQRRVASVIAIEVCEVYRLDRRDFRKCIALHTELFAKIEKIATDRIERAMVIEEQHKRYLMRSSVQANDSRRIISDSDFATINKRY